jgi:hypothetical protein
MRHGQNLVSKKSGHNECGRASYGLRKPLGDSINLVIERADVQATNDLSRVDASKILVIDFVNGVGQRFPVAPPGLLYVAEHINFW